MNAYFPAETWYAYHTGDILNVTTGSNIELPAPLDEIPIHVRGGICGHENTSKQI